MRIGFIGLGRMGANMVRRLVQRDHEIAIFVLAALRNEFGGHAVKAG
jgi:6-phosphogluconate dehydrogenase (decarboxylating)